MFNCGKCSSSFDRKDNLTRHIKKHNDDIFFTCGLCDRKFIRKDNLKRHEKNVHGMYSNIYN